MATKNKVAKNNTVAASSAVKTYKTKDGEIVAKHPGGRPTKYKPEYCEEIIKFFSAPTVSVVLEDVVTKSGEVVTVERSVANKLPTFERFCANLSVTTDTLFYWANENREFSVAYKKAKELQKDFWIENSMAGRYNAAFTIFAGKNMFGWRDKVEVEGNITHTMQLSTMYEQAKALNTAKNEAIEGEISTSE